MKFVFNNGEIADLEWFLLSCFGYYQKIVKWAIVLEIYVIVKTSSALLIFLASYNIRLQCKHLWTHENR